VHYVKIQKADETGLLVRQAREAGFLLEAFAKARCKKTCQISLKRDGSCPLEAYPSPNVRSSMANERKGCTCQDLSGEQLVCSWAS